MRMQTGMLLQAASSALAGASNVLKGARERGAVPRPVDMLLFC